MENEDKQQQTIQRKKGLIIKQKILVDSHNKICNIYDAVLEIIRKQTTYTTWERDAEEEGCLELQRGQENLRKKGKKECKIYRVQGVVKNN